VRLRLRPDRPLVSVLLPSYNHAEFVEEAVGSVLNQTVADLELIVVDDASTDGTADVVAGIRDPRLSLTRLPENRLVHPRNLALRLARGRFVAFQNSDDVWAPEKLARQLAVFAADPAAVAAFTGVRAIGADGAAIAGSWLDGLFQTENRSAGEWLRQFVDRGNCLCISSAIVRSRALRRVGPFDESLVNLSDFDLWVRLAAIGGLHVVPAELTDMRVVPGRNLSGPAPATARRGDLEEARVLERVAEPAALRTLARDCPDLVAPGVPIAVARAYLARHLWTLHASRRLAASRILADTLATTRGRRSVADHFGAALFREFAAHQTELEIAVRDPVAVPTTLG